MVSTMLSAAIRRQYSSVLPLLRHYVPVFDEIYGTALNFLILFSFGVTLIKIATVSQIDTSTVLVLSLIN